MVSCPSFLDAPNQESRDQQADKDNDAYGDSTYGAGGQQMLASRLMGCGRRFSSADSWRIRDGGGS